MIKKIKSSLSGSSDRAQLLRGGSGALILKVVNIVLTLGLSVVLTRALGVELFGIYTYIFAVITLLAVPAQFGMTTLIVRETVRSEANKDWNLLRGLWRWSNITASIISILLIIICILYAKFISNNDTLTDGNAFLYATIAIPFIALSSLRSASLQGLRKIVQSQLPESIIRPLLLILLFTTYLMFFSESFSSESAVILNVISLIISFIFGSEKTLDS